MANASISGLASGLDTATIISQLMQLEAVPQNQLKSRVSGAQSTIKSLQDLNARIASLATRAGELARPSGWQPLTVTSSSTAVTAATTGGVATGSFTMTVNQTAAAHRLTHTSTAQLTDTVTTGGTAVRLTINGQVTDLETGDGSLAGVVAALNASGTGVRATTLQLDDGTHRLIVQAGTTGAASAFTLTNTDGTDLLGGATVAAGRDAAITIGTDTLHSATNTFTGLMGGIDVTVSSAAVGTSVDITAETDTASVTERVKGFVDAVNAALAEIDRLTAYNTVTKSSGPLAGDSSVRSLRTTLLESVYPLDGTSLADVGIQTDRYGKLVFDEAAFTAAYAADPAAVTERFTAGAVPGFADRVATLATNASDKYDGTLTQAIAGRSSSVERLQGGIEAWDRRLELRRQSLTRQFTALETALSRMNSQSNWLAGQLSTLNPSSRS
ncbi:flagellar filament capping protein FliD [Nocardioides sp.]|uniref:flagellar filament capping protein FliD n=1 Tax=Nocardioides sp. TaxID=35761 RepID=UPI0027365F36|nr:flagellar filament capping protein FliD [Nocardioides sp.]MDP3894540.1 flagellar filament capping protein FliD [Nocardioides sp.]